jgi:hypothetical protein
MELSNDQKAILRLLAQRGAAGYDDLTALTGMTADEVHERAKAAAAQLEAEGIPAPSIPAPGSAEPGAPAQPPEPEPVLPPEAPAPRAAAKAPAAAPAPAKAPKPAPKASPKPAAGSRPKLALPSSGGARAALAAGAAVLVALIVVLAVSGGGDSGDTTTATSREATTASESTESAVNTAAGSAKLTQAVLSPVGGGDAKGLATFGRVKNSLALQIEAEGLAPTAKGQSYTVWLYESPQKMLPLASTAVGKNGKIGAQVEVPTEVLAYLAKETFDQLDVSLTDDATLKASLAKATKEKKAPLYTGTDVLRGQITGPIIGAANKKSAAGE